MGHIPAAASGAAVCLPVRPQQVACSPGCNQRLASPGVTIVEHDRQYYKALSGHAKLTIPRAWSFCQYTFLPKLPSVMVVEDASKDARCVYPERGWRQTPSSQNV